MNTLNSMLLYVYDRVCARSTSKELLGYRRSSPSPREKAIWTRAVPFVPDLVLTPPRVTPG